MVKKLNILVVDDSMTVRAMLVDELRALGYVAQGVGSAEETDEVLKKSDFDILLLDIYLPGMKGLEYLDKLRREKKDIIIIMMTAHESVQTAIEAIKGGAHDYVIKPIIPAHVDLIIKRALERHEISNELHLSKQRLEKTISDLNKANQLKTQFLANMSHELRTPINAIIGFTDLLLEDKDLDKKYRRDMSRISDNAQQLLTLINDILDLSKIEVGKITLSPAVFRLKPLLDDCIHSVKPMLMGREVGLELDISEDIPDIHSDRDRLRQVVINLLSNAAKFTEKGYIKVIANINENGLFHISVEDTGIGIREEDLSYIFEEFRQSHKGQKQKYSGTGLVLTISKRLAHLLGGNILVRSTFGEGSTFTLVIPPKLNKQEV